jgi:hypothetical protein
MGGTQATGTATVDNSISTGIGKITGFTVTNEGSGYTSAPMVQVTDTVNIVSATVATPIVVTLPNALSIPIGDGFGVTVSAVTGSTVISAATAAMPIVITIPSTTDITSVSILPGTYGLQGLNGTWFAKVTGPTTAELWADAGFTIPSQGTGSYVANSATLSANICGLQNAKVLSTTTVALYSDKLLSVPVIGVGTYTGGTVTGGGTGAAATATMGGGATNALQSFINGLPWPSTEGLAGGVVQFSVMLSVAFDLMKLLLGNLKTRASLLAGAKIGVSVMPGSINVSLKLLAKIQANLTANLNVKLPSLSVAASAALRHQISAIASLTAQIGFFLGLSQAGLGLELEVYQYTGPGSGLGAAIAAGPGTSGWHDGTGIHVPVTAGVFGLTTSASQGAFAAFFAGI